jgi:hypothetical protein
MRENQLSLPEKQVSSYATGERQKSAHIKNSLFLIQNKTKLHSSTEKL